MSLILSISAPAYRRRRLALDLASPALAAVCLSLLAFSRLGPGLAALSRRLASGETGAFLLFVLEGWILWSLVSLPISVGAVLLERRAGLTRTRPRRWAWEAAKGRAVAAAVSLPVLLAFHALLRRWPEWWWLPMGAVLFLVAVLLARLGPSLLLPLFVTQEAIRRGPLADRLRALCEEEGIGVVALYRLDLSRLSLKATAAFAGIGRSRRILLADTLLDHFEEDQIVAVVAHELAHRRLGHVPKGIALGLAATVPGLALAARIHAALAGRLGLGGPTRLEALPLLGLVLLAWGLLVLPAQNAVLRRWEFAADRFAARRASSRALGSALRRLGRRNLADPDPPRLEEFLLHDHPSLTRRLAALGETS